MHIWRSEEFWELMISYHAGSGNPTQVGNQAWWQAISLDHIYVLPHRFFTYFTQGLMCFFTYSPGCIIYIFLIHSSQALSGCLTLNKMALLPLYHKTIGIIHRLTLIHIDYSQRHTSSHAQVHTDRLCHRHEHSGVLGKSWSSFHFCCSPWAGTQAWSLGVSLPPTQGPFSD